MCVILTRGWRYHEIQLLIWHAWVVDTPTELFNPDTLWILDLMVYLEDFCWCEPNDASDWVILNSLVEKTIGVSCHEAPWWLANTLVYFLLGSGSTQQHTESIFSSYSCICRGRLSTSDIENMLAEAERFKAEDEDRLKRVSDGFMCVYPCCPCPLIQPYCRTGYQWWQNPLGDHRDPKNVLIKLWDTLSVWCCNFF